MRITINTTVQYAVLLIDTEPQNYTPSKQSVSKTTKYMALTSAPVIKTIFQQIILVMCFLLIVDSITVLEVRDSRHISSGTYNKFRNQAWQVH